MLFVDIRRESAAVSLRIPNDRHLAEIDQKCIRRNPVVGGCPLWRAASVGNRPFTMPWECAGEVVPEGGRNTPGDAHRSGFRVRLSGL
jgi:hypothetical protein